MPQSTSTTQTSPAQQNIGQLLLHNLLNSLVNASLAPAQLPMRGLQYLSSPAGTPFSSTSPDAARNLLTNLLQTTPYTKGVAKALQQLDKQQEQAGAQHANEASASGMPHDDIRQHAAQLAQQSQGSGATGSWDAPSATPNMQSPAGVPNQQSSPNLSSGPQSGYSQQSGGGPIAGGGQPLLASLMSMVRHPQNIQESMYQGVGVNDQGQYQTGGTVPNYLAGFAHGVGTPGQMQQLAGIQELAQLTPAQQLERAQAYGYLNPAGRAGAIAAAEAAGRGTVERQLPLTPAEMALHQSQINLRPSLAKNPLGGFIPNLNPGAEQTRNSQQLSALLTNQNDPQQVQSIIDRYTTPTLPGEAAPVSLEQASQIYSTRFPGEKNPYQARVNRLFLISQQHLTDQQINHFNRLRQSGHSFEDALAQSAK